MGEPSNAEISKQISDLRSALLENRVDEKTGKTQLSELKEYLVQTSPKIVTEDWVKTTFAPYFKKIDEMHQELTKAKKTEWMEAMGLGSFAAAVEKWHENNAWWPVYLFSGFMSLAVPAFLIALALNFKNLQRGLQTRLFDRLAGRFPTLRNQVIAGGPGGILPRLQDRDVVRQREEAAGGGMAAIPRNADFEPLRRQLEALNPELLKFNNRAPSFIREFRKLPKENAATKAAAGVKKIADAIRDVDHGQMQPVATGVNKINNAMRNADPKKIEKVAKATAKLKLATTGFNPDRIPKAGPLQDAATAAGNLARQIGPLDRALAGLRTTVGQLNTGLS
ncbi:hypothetical protein [Streptomyces sp. NBC_01353]|uniref:hypothetical protein n=1 Tax=Streptomyces sp. NBC_01353 TaxID=2903835 RepID=UPI002E336494|nr:hypothetical protein [Streptomyces sp. NBC_01353]